MPGRRLLVVLAVALLAVVPGAGPAAASGAPPNAQSDSYLTYVGVKLVVDPPGLLANDSDPDGDPLTARLDTQAHYGDAHVRSDGSFAYTPNAGFAGTDVFGYRAFDGTSYSQPAWVFVRVNARPVARADSYGVVAPGPLKVARPGVLLNDGDPGGDVLTAKLLTPPAHGRLTLQPDGSFVYRPHAGFLGRDSFVYAATDGDLDSEPATVRLRVGASNAPPVGQADVFPEKEDHDLHVQAPGVLGNDTDADGDPLRAEVVNEPGPVEYFDLRPDGSFVIQPQGNYDSDFTFTYRVGDGIEWSPPITVKIDMQAIDDPPVANEDSYDVEYETPLVEPVPGVVGNDEDVEDDTLHAIGPITPPSHGQLHLHPDGSFRYVPDHGFSGHDSFTYQVADARRGTIGTVDLYVSDP